MPERFKVNPRKESAIERLKREFSFGDEEIKKNKEFNLFNGHWGENELHELITFIKNHQHELRKPSAEEIAYLAPLYAKGIIKKEHIEAAINTIKKHAKDLHEWGWDDVGKLSYAATMHFEHLDEVARTLRKKHKIR